MAHRMLQMGGLPLAVVIAIAISPPPRARADETAEHAHARWARRVSIDFVAATSSPSGSMGAALRLAPIPAIELSLGGGGQLLYRGTAPTGASPSVGGSLSVRFVGRNFALGLGPTLAWTGEHVARYLMSDGTRLLRRLEQAWFAGVEAYFEVRYLDGTHFRIFAGASGLAVAQRDECSGDVQWCDVARDAALVRASFGIAYGVSFR